jgi:hypothetical protein
MSAMAQITDLNIFRKKKEVEGFFELILSDTETKYSKLRDILQINNLDRRFSALDTLHLFLIKNCEYPDEVFEDIVWKMRCETLLLQISQENMNGGQI